MEGDVDPGAQRAEQQPVERAQFAGRIAVEKPAFDRQRLGKDRPALDIPARIERAHRVRRRLRLDRQLHHMAGERSEEHTSELQSLMRTSYAVFCLKNKKKLSQTHKLTASNITIQYPQK